MFVIGPVVVAVKYEMDWALASFWSVEVPIAVFPKVDELLPFTMAANVKVERHNMNIVKKPYVLILFILILFILIFFI